MAGRAGSNARGGRSGHSMGAERQGQAESHSGGSNETREAPGRFTSKQLNQQLDQEQERQSRADKQRQANLDTVARRESIGYSPSSRSDRRGTKRAGTTGFEGSFRDGIREAAEEEGYGDEAGLVASLAMGPAVGYTVKTAIDAYNRAEMEAAVMGTEANYGKAVKEAAVDNVKDGLVSMVGSGIGGAIGGALAGQTGAVVGSTTGGKALAGFVEDQQERHEVSSGPSPEHTGGGGLLASVKVGQPGDVPNQVQENTSAAGFDSSFGNYDSHLSGFKYSIQSASEAWI